ncbi:hypothetical protein HDZ31DRAFT_63654 [Schizophyllum fasciatum]
MPLDPEAMRERHQPRDGRGRASAVFQARKNDVKNSITARSDCDGIPSVEGVNAYNDLDAFNAHEDAHEPDTDVLHDRWGPPPDSSSDDLGAENDMYLHLDAQLARPRTPTPDYGTDEDDEDDAEVLSYVLEATTDALPPLSTISYVPSAAPESSGSTAPCDYPSSSVHNSSTVYVSSSNSSSPITSPSAYTPLQTLDTDLDLPRHVRFTPSPSRLSFCLYAETGAQDVNEGALRRGAAYLRRAGLKRKASWAEADWAAFKKARAVELSTGVGEGMGVGVGVDVGAGSSSSNEGPKIFGWQPGLTPEPEEIKADLVETKTETRRPRRSSLTLPVATMPRVDEEGEDEPDSETDSEDEAINVGISSRSGFYIV